MEFHGTGICQYGIPWNSMEFVFGKVIANMQFHGTCFREIKFYGIPWKVQRNSIEFHGTLLLLEESSGN